MASNQGRQRQEVCRGFKRVMASSSWAGLCRRRQANGGQGQRDDGNRCRLPCLGVGRPRWRRARPSRARSAWRPASRLAGLAFKVKLSGWAPGWLSQGLEQVFAGRVFARLGFQVVPRSTSMRAPLMGALLAKVVQIQAQLLAFGDNQQLEHFAMGVGAQAPAWLSAGGAVSCDSSPCAQAAADGNQAVKTNSVRQIASRAQWLADNGARARLQLGALGNCGLRAVRFARHCSGALNWPARTAR